MDCYKLILAKESFRKFDNVYQNIINGGYILHKLKEMCFFLYVNDPNYLVNPLWNCCVQKVKNITRWWWHNHSTNSLSFTSFTHSPLSFHLDSLSAHTLFLSVWSFLCMLWKQHLNASLRETSAWQPAFVLFPPSITQPFSLLISFLVYIPGLSFCYSFC